MEQPKMDLRRHIRIKSRFFSLTFRFLRAEAKSIFPVFIFTSPLRKHALQPDQSTHSVLCLILIFGFPEHLITYFSRARKIFQFFSKCNILSTRNLLMISLLFYGTTQLLYQKKLLSIPPSVHLILKEITVHLAKQLYIILRSFIS